MKKYDLLKQDEDTLKEYMRTGNEIEIYKFYETRITLEKGKLILI